MASCADKEEIMLTEKETQMEAQENREEIVSLDLPAPEGWKKKFTPKKGGTPRRNDIVFISPTGDEIKNKRQLDQFLKAHPGGPSSSEFYWGTGDTPRRSARISDKSKATETPESEPPTKRERKSSSEKGAKEKEDSDDGEDEAAAATAEETKARAEVKMKEAEDVGNKNNVVVEDIVKQDSVRKTEEKIDTKDGQKENNSQPPPGAKENTEKVEKEQPAECEAPLPPSLPNEEASPEEVAMLAVETSHEKKVEAANEAFFKKEAKMEEASSEDAKVREEVSTEKEANVGESIPDNGSLKESQGETKPKETHPINCKDPQHQPKASPVSC